MFFIFRVDFKQGIMYAKFMTPKFQLEGKYTMKGKILLLPIYGTGTFKVTLCKYYIFYSNSFILKPSFDLKTLSCIFSKVYDKIEH